MSFSRNPKVDGVVDLAFGLPLAALWLLRCYELDCWTNVTTIVSYIYLAFIIFGGAYKLLFRHGAIEGEVTLGGFYSRMYLRLGWWFLPVGLAAPSCTRGIRSRQTSQGRSGRSSGIPGCTSGKGRVCIVSSVTDSPPFAKFLSIVDGCGTR